jgi:prephenate dehydrogenase
MIPQLPQWHVGSPLVMDLGSTKVKICEALSQLPARFHGIGGHPMCGKEFSSVQYAESDLYKDATFALCATPSTREEDRQIAEALVAAVGAKPLWLDARTHDQWVAATSHTPYLIANALAAVTPVEAKPLVGPGLRSTSRLAGSNLRMMMDILSTNREAVLNQLELYQTQLNRLRELILLQSQDELFQEISFGRDKYQEIITIKESK